MTPVYLSNTYFVFGANTDVGKTWFCSALAVLSRKYTRDFCYVKPLQTGANATTATDAFAVKRCAPEKSVIETLYSWKDAVSPHLAVSRAGASLSSPELLDRLNKFLDVHCVETGLTLIETAGGPASPATDFVTQAELYKKLGIPALLVGDGKLGGISTTITAYQYLKTLGYEVSAVVFTREEQENSVAVQKICKIPVFTFSAKAECIESWVEKNISELNEIDILLRKRSAECAKYTAESLEYAKTHFWWPFTQHQNVDKVTYVHAAHGCTFLTSAGTKEDAISSWWTNGLGHGDTALAQTIASAAARYGHVLFPEHVHEPAVVATKELLSSAGHGWANRVFFSDNGSTAVEVALKMAFRLREKRCGPQEEWKVLGLSDSYHGDTKGAMDASSPNAFKTSEKWYAPKGVWLDAPYAAYEDGDVIVRNGEKILAVCGTVDDLFESSRLRSALFREYFNSIETKVCASLSSLGALLIEPLLHGSGGMKLCDPLFQAALIHFAREHKIPIIYDEVFVGLWRLGVASCADLLFSLKPDIACYGKLLTGGSLPMAVTLTTEEVFECFLGKSKENALLHGHSYTAYPAGCAAIAESIRRYKDGFNAGRRRYWDDKLVTRLSRISSVKSVVALGSVLAAEFKANDSGYFSNSVSNLIALACERGIEFRPLGNVLYFVVPLNASDAHCASLLDQLIHLATEANRGS